MKVCNACGKELDAKMFVGRRDVCSSCRADLHCCRNCSLHDPRASRQCREPVAQPVKDRNKANFCDYFAFRETVQGVGEDATGKARKQLDELFKP